MKQTILFAANRGYALKSSRQLLIQRLLDAGHKVVLATADDSESRALTRLGAILEPIRFARSGFSLLEDFDAIRRIRSLHLHYKPQFVHHFHAKPIIGGAIAVALTGNPKPSIINTITGLGQAFTSKGVSRKISEIGFWFGLRRSTMTIFQNSDDMNLFRENGWVPEARSCMVLGSGVDLQFHKFVDRSGRKNECQTVVMIGRLLGEKGIREFSEIARLVKQILPDVSFVLAGEHDPKHPDAISLDWIASQESIEYIGRLEDIRPLLSRADIFLFPSYYREGVPRVIMEAAASGIPAIALNVPGVREAIEMNTTGILVPIGDMKALLNATLQILKNQTMRLEMGTAARQRAEKYFNINEITEAYIAIYRKIGLEI